MFDAGAAAWYTKWYDDSGEWRRIYQRQVDGNMADYYGVSLPRPVMSALDQTFGFLAKGDEHTVTNGNKIGNLQSEAIAQVYGILYYITNQPKISRSRAVS